jgi:hypothetical protein
LLARLITTPLPSPNQHKQTQAAARGTNTAANAARAGVSAVQSTQSRTNFGTPAGRR